MKPNEFEELDKNNQEQVARLLDKFLSKHGGNLRADTARMNKGEAFDVISGFNRENDIDHLAMGTVLPSGVAGMSHGPYH